eukprot:PhM_4_TR5957/c1_g1_i1/m.15781
MHVAREGSLVAAEADGVDVVRRHEGVEDGVLVGLGDALHQHIEGNLFEQDLREVAVQHLRAQRVVAGHAGVEHAVVQHVHAQRELVGEHGARNLAAKTRVLALDAVELTAAVAVDDVVDALHVLLVEVRGLAGVAGDAHELLVLGGAHGEGREDLEGRGRDAALVGRRVQEQHDAVVLEREAGLGRDEQVRALDDVAVAEVLDVVRRRRHHDVAGELLGLQQHAVHVRDVDGTGTAAAGHEEIGALDREVERVAEGVEVLHDGAVGEVAPGLLVGGDDEAVLGDDALGVEVLRREVAVHEARELLAVEAVGVVQDSVAVDHRDGLVLAHRDLVGTEVTGRAGRLHLLDVGLLQAPLLAHAALEHGDAHRGHAVRVVGDTADGGRLAGREGLVVRVAALAREVHGHVGVVEGGVLVGAEEDELRLAEAVDDALLVGQHHVAQ